MPIPRSPTGIGWLDVSRRSRGTGPPLTKILVLCSVVLLSLTACTGGTSSALRGVLRGGVQEARSSFSGYLDDITVITRETVIEVPSGLDDAVRQADDAVRAGTKLSDEEAELLASSERWVAFFKELDEVLQLAVGWEIGMNDDAVRLVNASLLTNPSPEFRVVVEGLEQKLLRGLMCQAARSGLDDAADTQAAAATPNYDAFGLEQDDVEGYIITEIDPWPGAYDVLDYSWLASQSIDLHNDYVDGVMDVIESPDGTLAAANLIYFRSCVVRK